MSRPEGPFDRLLRARTQRDPAPFIIGGTVVFVGLVILLVFLLSGVFGGNGDGGGTAVEKLGITGRYGQMPGLPPGLVAASDFVEFDTEGDISRTIGLPLRTPLEDETGLGFYTYREGRWQREAEARLTENGQRAEADFSPVPQNLAVLRVVAQAYQVAGSLPSGGTLHDDANVDIVSPRDYTPQSDGSLGGSATEVVVGPDVLVIPTIVGSGEDTASVVNDILADESLRARHMEEILRLPETGEFAGVDLEYTLVDPELRSEFTSFVQELGRALREDGRRLSLALPPPGPQRQGYDWRLLGEAADIIRILPVADPVDYWDTVPKALDQLVEDVDPRKVMLVVNPFSAELTDGVSRPLGYLEALVLASEIQIREPQDPQSILTDTGVNVVAVNLAQSEGATSLRWSDEAAALSFSYLAPARRTVYVENVFSVRFKLEQVQTYALGGVAVADASAERDVANIWPAVNELIGAGTVALVRPNGDTLVPRWEAPDGGRLDAPAGPSVIWRSEDPGSFTLRMLISDGDKLFGQEIEVEVKEKATPQPTPQGTPTPLVTFPAQEPTPTTTPTTAPTRTPTPTPTPDSDGDGVPNSADNCPNNSNRGQQDGDGDGIGDACDNCPNDENATQADADGDGLGNLCDDDDDDDGVGDEEDLCPGTAAKDKVDEVGCSDAQVDADGDGICDPNPASDGPNDCDSTVADTEGPPGNSNGVGGADDCTDGVDNDADGDIDTADAGCA